jgi:hypothetical protein
MPAISRSRPKLEALVPAMAGHRRRDLSECRKAIGWQPVIEGMPVGVVALDLIFVMPLRSSIPASKAAAET